MTCKKHTVNHQCCTAVPFNVIRKVQIEMCVAALSLLKTDSKIRDEFKVGIERYVYTLCIKDFHYNRIIVLNKLRL